MQDSDAIAVKGLLMRPDRHAWIHNYRGHHPLVRAAAFLARLTGSTHACVPVRPQHEAARQNNVVIIDMLWAEGMNVNAREPPHGDTPLHVAVRSRHVASCVHLLKHMADTSIICRDFNASALSLAIRNMDALMVETLVTHGTRHGTSVAGVDWVTNTQLHVAVLWNRTDEVARLIAAGADLDAPMKGGHTPAHIAAHFGHASALRLLMAAGAKAAPISEWHYTPLHFAAMREQPRCVEVLLETGRLQRADLNRRDKEGHTPLALAVYYARTTNVDLILKAGCDPNMLDAAGDTMLHYCADRGGAREKLYIKQLLEAGADSSGAL